MCSLRHLVIDRWGLGMGLGRLTNRQFMFSLAIDLPMLPLFLIMLKAVP